MEEFEPIWSLGCMSGTSMDGVDAAMVLTDGEHIHQLGDRAYRYYSDDEKRTIRKGQGLWQDECPETLKQVEETVRRAHLEIITWFVDGADLVGFHGQTLAHDPASGRTHQVGNGKRLAEESGYPVVWDFRSQDMANGGEGAPLAPIFHFAFAKWLGETRPVAILNLGGVANITYVDPSAPTPETPGALVAFDTGPANALVNDLVSSRLNEDYDTDGSLAAAGTSDPAIIEEVLSRPYFDRAPPKSLDRNEFEDVLGLVSSLSDADAAATLTALTAATVAQAVSFLPTRVTRWLVAGGGVHNRTLMAELQARIGVPVISVDDYHVNPDMLEAQAFAFLAVRSMRNFTLSLPSTTGCRAPTTGGRLDLPSQSS